ncbi:MAG: hypothetical protein JSV25_07755 [Spirochaetota bacterium]|nr:MAG: hypothetical protein JSV25_07755 [Spirochaetota bacterium]
MKKVYIILFILTLILAFVTITKEKIYARDLLYETDFSYDDGAFNREQRGVVNEIKDGMLHLKGFGDAKVATAELKKLYGDNSETSFRIKFGAKRIKVEALAEVDFLCLRQYKNRFIVDFFEDRLELNTRIAGKTVERTSIPAAFSIGRWYDVQVTIKDYRLSISIDGKHMKTISLDRRLPLQGYLTFSAHEEFWVDDLKIVQERVELKKEMELVYETYFDRDDGAFSHEPPGEINEIRGGILHLKATSLDRPATAHLNRIFGNNSVTKFRIKFRKRVQAHLVLLNMKGDYLIVFFSANRLHFVTMLNHKEMEDYSEKISLNVGRWYEIVVSIKNYTASVDIDGETVGSVALDTRLPAKGYMEFGCWGEHEEYWVDDLRIVQEPTSIKEEPFEVVEAPEEIKEKRVDVAMELMGEGLELSNVEFENIFPVFFKYYDEYPIGKGVLRNYETRPITDIEVKLFIKQYMDNPKICRTPTELKAGEEKEVELNALFTNKVLEITEGTKVSANITIEYKLNGKKKEIDKLETIRIQNRNAITWEDDRRAAAFVTAKDPVILKFSKNIAGMIKTKGSKAINANLRMAMAIHEALTLFGMNYVIDPTTPYKEFSKKRQEIDFLQFPKQSLDYKAGDCDDLSILYSALLESVGIETAFITIPGHIFMAFSVDMEPDEARKRFLRADELIFREDKTWIPVEITEIGGGFLKAWQKGAKEWRENVARGQAGFYPIHEAWSTYEPVGLPGEVIQLTLPDRDSIVSAYLQELIQFIDREIYPQVAKLQAEIKKSKGDPKEVNKLGILYARYGLVDRAEREFKKILEKNKDFVPALVNLGNICYLDNDMKSALTYYEKASKLDPKNPRVLLCVARTNHELENYGLVKEAYSSLKRLNPDLAYQFSYLDLRGEEAVRAAEIGKVKEVVIWEE